MSFEQVGIDIQLRGAQKAAKESKDLAKSLRDSAAALEDQIDALKAEEKALRSKTVVDKQAIAAIRGQIGALRQAAQATRSNAVALREHAAASRTAVAGMRSVETAAKGLGGVFGGLGGIVGTALAAFSTLSAVKLADDYNVLQARIRNVTAATGDYVKVSGELSTISKEVGASLETTVDVFSRLQIGLKEVGASNSQILQLTRTVEQLGAIGGASATALEAGLLQFGQAMGAGIVRAEEFNSVVENLPKLAQAIADGLGVSLGQLRLMVIDGKVLSKDVFEALQKQSAAIQEEFDKMPISFSRGLNSLTVSLQEALGKLDQAVGATSSLGRALADAGKAAIQLAESLAPVIQSLGEMISSALNLIGRLAELAGITGTVRDAFSGLNSIFQATQFFLVGLANLFDNVAFGLQKLGVYAEQTIKKLDAIARFGGTQYFRGVANSIDKTAEMKLQVIDQQQRTAIGGRTVRLMQSLKGNIGKAKLQDPTLIFPGGGSGGRGSSGAGGKASRRSGGSSGAAKASQIERERISDIQSGLRDDLEDIGINTTLSKSRQRFDGARSDTLKIELRGLVEEQRRLQAASEALRATEVKTKEALKAKQQAIRDVSQELKRNEASINENKNAQLALADSIKRTQEAAQRERDEIRYEGAAESFQDSRREQIERLREVYEQGKVSATDYYNTLTQLQNEIVNLDIEALNLKKKNVEANNRDLRAKLREPGEALADSVEGAISNAIVSAFGDEGPLNAIKNFAKALRDAIVKAFADQIAGLIRRALDPLFQQIGSVLNGISGASASTGATPGGLIGTGISSAISKLSSSANTLGKGVSSLTTFLKSPAFGALAGVAIAGVGASVASKNKSFGQNLVGTGMGIGGGALAGLMVGGPIGAVIGGGLGGLASAGSASGGKFDAKAGLLGLPFGLLGFGIAGFLGGANKKRKEEEERAKRLAAAQAAVSRALGGIDQNRLNLIDLKKRAVELNNFTSGGGDAFRMKRDGVLQLKELIKQRQQQISSFLVQKKDESRSLDFDLLRSKAGNELDTAKIDRDQALEELKRDTQRELKRYRDSQKARTRILEVETKKRELILSQFTAAEKAYAEEQEAIRKQEAESLKQQVANLTDLLKQRDDIENANVFKRLRSRETVKSDNLKAIDVEIAKSFKALQEAQAKGALPTDLQGINVLLKALSDANTQKPPVDAALNIVINGANDPNAVAEEVRRAMSAFFGKQLGVVLP